MHERKRRHTRHQVKENLAPQTHRCKRAGNSLMKSMVSVDAKSRMDDARLWAVALCVSVVLNLLLLAWVSIEAIQSELARKNKPPAVFQPEQTVRIFPEMLERIEEVPVAAAKQPEAPPELARTTPDQESAEPPASRRYIGERNTNATSDRAPTSDDASMPSQAGREARPEEAPETTESRYQDGKLNTADPVPSLPADPAPFSPEPPEMTKAETAKGEKRTEPSDAEKAETAIREKILDGPNPIDTPVAKSEVREDMKPREEKKARDGAPDALAEKKAEDLPKPKPSPVSDPAFTGNQSKTAIQGNISRTGRSALDVADSPMGRYQAQISRAVELEWQRNCVKHRDFITPGYLTVRFFVADDGRVKSVQFLGDSETGEVQKGFTLNSIRNAPIPAMPKAVKKEMGGDALELIFNFYF